LNNFWVDLSKHLVNNEGKADGFLSENFIYSNTCHAEMICALAVLDLDFLGGDFELVAK